MSELAGVREVDQQLRATIREIFQGESPDTSARPPEFGAKYQAIFCVSYAQAASISYILGVLLLSSVHPEVFDNPETDAAITRKTSLLVSRQAAFERFCTEELGQDWRHVLNLSDPQQLEWLDSLAPVHSQFPPDPVMREQHFGYLVELWRGLVGQPWRGLAEISNE